MGGSRCTYRNCTVRTDGVVHMFHYPVYDKIRCHQWLVNAQRLDFLNLKLSQVRNRVVCQHHFKDDCFMNYKKEKLTFDAVPTENGIFCNSSKEDRAEPAQHIGKVYSITLSDLEENDKYSKKNLKANTNVIYADFLTNGDAWEKQSLNETIWNNMVTTKKQVPHKEHSKINLDWPEAGGVQVTENQKSMITMTDFIVEFENPLLANVDFSENKEYDIQQNFRPKELGSNGKSQKDQYGIIKDDNNTIVNQEFTNKSIKHEQNVTLSAPEPDLSELLLNQENNMIINYNNSADSNNIKLQKIADMVPADQGIQALINIQNKNQIIQPAKLSSNNLCAIIQNPNEPEVEIYRNKFEKPKDITTHQWDAKKSKITILSEKRISNPVLLKGNLEPVSPSSYIKLPKKSFSFPTSNKAIECESNETVSEKVNLPFKECNEPVTELAIEYKGNKAKTEEINTNENIPPVVDGIQKTKNVCRSLEKKRIITSNQVVPKTPVLKHKIAPERVAAIEKKRNFNKKLRDIIEICLDKLDDQEKTEDTKVADSPKSDQKEKAKTKNQNIATYLSKQRDLPNAQEYMMSFFEARMKKMEDTLLGKIEQNSQRIVELKHSITKSSQGSKVAATQTTHSEESYKKQLYHELSKFLSPNTNSLVYEELFINKHQLSSSTPKRRKHR